MGEASRYDRVVLKLSGEVFADTTTGSGIDAAVVQRIAEEVAAVNTELGVEIAVVVGGGNIFRGMPGAERGMDRARADYMGMLATVINALALQDALEGVGQPTRVQTAITMAQIAEPYIPRRAISRTVRDEVGTAIRALLPDLVEEQERRARARREALVRWRQAPTLETLSAALYPNLPPGSTPNSLALTPDEKTLFVANADNNNIAVFDVSAPGNIHRALLGEPIGTLVSSETAETRR